MALGIGSVLFLHGYYLTTAMFGVLWRSQRPWVYPVIAAALLVFHTHIVFVRLKPDLSSSGRAAEVKFEAGGACIVFACAFLGVGQQAASLTAGKLSSRIDWTVRIGGLHRTLFPLGVAAHLSTVGIVDQAIQDAIGNPAITNLLVPPPAHQISTQWGPWQAAGAKWRESR